MSCDLKAQAGGADAQPAPKPPPQASFHALGGQIPFSHFADYDVEFQIITHDGAFVRDLELAAARHYDERDRIPFHRSVCDLLLAVRVRDGAGELLAINVEIEVDLQRSVGRLQLPFPLPVQIGGVGCGKARQHYDRSENERAVSHFGNPLLAGRSDIARPAVIEYTVSVTIKSCLLDNTPALARQPKACPSLRWPNALVPSPRSAESAASQLTLRSSQGSRSAP